MLDEDRSVYTLYILTGLLFGHDFNLLVRLRSLVLECLVLAALLVGAAAVMLLLLLLRLILLLLLFDRLLLLGLLPEVHL